MSTSVPSDRRQFLSFTLAGCDYGVPILHVKEILQYEAITRVPSVPRWIRGIINLRGAVVPVVDLAVKLGLSETAVTPRTCILIVEANLGADRTVMGVLADAVIEVLDLGPGDVEPPPPFGTGIGVDHLTGMAKVGKGFVLLLEIDRVLSVDEKELVVRAPPEQVRAPTPEERP